jgi:hypothetical protein
MPPGNRCGASGLPSLEWPFAPYSDREHRRGGDLRGRSHHVRRGGNSRSRRADQPAPARRRRELFDAIGGGLSRRVHQPAQLGRRTAGAHVGRRLTGLSLVIKRGRLLEQVRRARPGRTPGDGRAVARNTAGRWTRLRLAPQGEVHLRDAHRVVSFIACRRAERSGNRASGRHITFWSVVWWPARPGACLSSSGWTMSLGPAARSSGSACATADSPGFRNSFSGAGGGTRTRTPPVGTPAFKAGASHPFRHPGPASVGGRRARRDARERQSPRPRSRTPSWVYRERKPRERFPRESQSPRLRKRPPSGISRERKARERFPFCGQISSRRAACPRAGGARSRGP